MAAKRARCRGNWFRKVSASFGRFWRQRLQLSAIKRTEALCFVFRVACTRDLVVLHKHKSSVVQTSYLARGKKLGQGGKQLAIGGSVTGRPHQRPALALTCREMLPKPAANATSVIGRCVSWMSCLASSTRLVSATATGEAPRCCWNKRRNCRSPTPRRPASASTSASSSAPCSIRLKARDTVFDVPRQAPRSGAVSGLQRRQGRKPDYCGRGCAARWPDGGGVWPAAVIAGRTSDACLSAAGGHRRRRSRFARHAEKPGRRAVGGRSRGRRRSACV